MRNGFVLCAITVGFFVWMSSPSEAASEKFSFFVATNGNDTNPGTELKPFASLEHARNIIRNLKQKRTLPSSGVTVLIRGGTYSLSKTFELTDKDSGTDKAPIVYRPYNNEEVHLIGGKQLIGF